MKLPTAADLFRESLIMGSEQLPFQRAIVLKVNGQQIHVPPCAVIVGTNKLDHDRYGADQVHTISASVPKEAIDDRPMEGRDAITDGNRDYKIVNVEGDDECSPFWMIDGEAPQ